MKGNHRRRPINEIIDACESMKVVTPRLLNRFWRNRQVSQFSTINPLTRLNSSVFAVTIVAPMA